MNYVTKRQAEKPALITTPGCPHIGQRGVKTPETLEHTARHLTGALVIAAGLFVLASPLPAQEQECHCEIWQTHLMGSSEFATSSCVYPHDANYVMYETCIKNLDDSELEFRWYIPGPHGWIPGGWTLPSPRLRTDDHSLQRQDGCLRYGGLHKLHDAEFEPHVSDKTDLEWERQAGCLRVRGEREYAQSVGPDDVSPLSRQAGDVPPLSLEANDIPPLSNLRLSVFAPTDRERPSDTMIRIDATVNWVSQEGQLIHSLGLRAYPYGRDFRPENIRLVPQSAWLRAAYSAAYLETDAGRLPVVDGERSPFSLNLTEEVQGPLSFQEVRFDVVTVGNNVVMLDNDEVVASLLVPFWGGR